jgi:hypothetical protein
MQTNILQTTEYVTKRLVKKRVFWSHIYIIFIFLSLFTQELYQKNKCVDKHFRFQLEAQKLSASS